MNDAQPLPPDTQNVGADATVLPPAPDHRRRTKGYRMLRSDSFPRRGINRPLSALAGGAPGQPLTVLSESIGGDRYRLDTLIARENAQLAAARPAKPVPTLPPRKRVRASLGQ